MCINSYALNDVSEYLLRLHARKRGVSECLLTGGTPLPGVLLVCSTFTNTGEVIFGLGDRWREAQPSRYMEYCPRIGLLCPRLGPRTRASG